MARSLNLLGKESRHLAAKRSEGSVFCCRHTKKERPRDLGPPPNSCAVRTTLLSNYLQRKSTTHACLSIWQPSSLDQLGLESIRRISKSRSTYQRCIAVSMYPLAKISLQGSWGICNHFWFMFIKLLKNWFWKLRGKNKNLQPSHGRVFINQWMQCKLWNETVNVHCSVI